MKRRLVVPLLAMLAACGGADEPAEPPPAEVVVLTHDSFAMPKKVLQEFTDETGLQVKIVNSGDAGQLVNAAILSAGTPAGDVLFGVDNTFLSRAREAGAFDSYQSPRTPPRLREDAAGVTPVDTGAVCLNYDRDFFADRTPPSGLADRLRAQRE